MFKNPELQRNLWLEFSRHRIVIMPCIIGLVLLVAYVNDRYRLGENFYNTAIWMYFALTVLWGGRLAGESVVQEMNDKTWDNQRMSSLSPWTMTLGKYLGSTMIVWYGAVICLICVVFVPSTVIAREGPPLVYLISVCILAAVLSQLISFVASLVSIRKGLKQNRSISSIYLILGIITASYVAGLAFNMRAGTSIFWHGAAYGAFPFILVSLSLFCGWTMLAAYRLMRVELQVKSIAIYWTLFVIFVAIFVSGFIVSASPNNSFHQLLVGYTIVVALTYLVAFADSKNPIIFRRLFFSIKNKDWRKVLETIPAWFFCLILMSVSLLMLVLANNETLVIFNYSINFRFYAIAIFMFALRDIGLILYFNFSAKAGRADMTAFIYMLILYYLIPLLFSAANLDIGLALLTPLSSAHPYVTLISAGAQVSLVSYLCYRRWKSNFSLSK